MFLKRSIFYLKNDCLNNFFDGCFEKRCRLIFVWIKNPSVLSVVKYLLIFFAI